MEWVIIVEKYMPIIDITGIVPRNFVGKKNLIFSTIPHLLQFNKLFIASIIIISYIAISLCGSPTLKSSYARVMMIVWAVSSNYSGT